jgi:hypothetical protein
MDFNDIPQFPQSYYSIGQPWDTIESYLERHVTEYHLNLEPDFQRGSEFTGRLDFSAGFKIHIARLQTRKEVLDWYVNFNSGGTVHPKKEIDRVKKMIEIEK